MCVQISTVVVKMGKFELGEVIRTNPRKQAEVPYLP
jgi:hypothetical protein